MKHTTKAGLGLTAALLLVSSVSMAQNAEWTGGGDNATWNDANNWDTLQVPGAAGSIPNNAWIAAPNHAGLLTVDVDGLHPVGLTAGNSLRLDAGQTDSQLTVNINAGATLNVNGALNSMLTINEGGTTTTEGYTTVNVAGTLNVGQIRMARDTGTSHLKIVDGGLINMDPAGGDLEMRADKADATSIFEMTGGTWTSGNNRQLKMGTIDSQLLFSGTASMQGSDFSVAMDYGGQAGSTDLLSLSGSALDVTFERFNAFQVDTAVGATATISFESDATGISLLTITDKLDLDGDAVDDFKGDLIVDLSAYTGATDGTVVLDLISYKTLEGEFGNVTVIGGGGIDGTINYGSGDQDIITLTVIPEPATFGLLAVVGGGLLFVRRRFAK